MRCARNTVIRIATAPSSSEFFPKGCRITSLACRFLLKQKLCALSTEYSREGEDLASAAFEAIVFVKVRGEYQYSQSLIPVPHSGKFTKRLPKQKETCLDKSEYKEYVTHEVPKWLGKSKNGFSSQIPAYFSAFAQEELGEGHQPPPSYNPE